MTKPIVHYSGEAQLILWPYQEEDGNIHVAHLSFVWDHPRLGICYNVRTSAIVVMPDEHGTFETLNTIYQKVNEDHPES